MAVKLIKSKFHVSYKVKEDDLAINMRASTDSLEELHKLLCGMDSFRTPLAQWHQLDIHEHLMDGSVAVIPQAHLANLFDWQYGFGKKQELGLEDKEAPTNTEEPPPLTAVTVVRRKYTQPLLSTAPWWKEIANAY